MSFNRPVLVFYFVFQGILLTWTGKHANDDETSQVHNADNVAELLTAWRQWEDVIGHCFHHTRLPFLIANEPDCNKEAWTAADDELKCGDSHHHYICRHCQHCGVVSSCAELDNYAIIAKILLLSKGDSGFKYVPCASDAICGSDFKYLLSLYRRKLAEIFTHLFPREQKCAQQSTKFFLAQGPWNTN